MADVPVTQVLAGSLSLSVVRELQVELGSLRYQQARVIMIHSVRPCASTVTHRPVAQLGPPPGGHNGGAVATGPP